MSFFFIAPIILALYSPMLCHGEEYDFLIEQSCLESDIYNYTQMVMTMGNGDEYIGEGEVYITEQQGRTP
jgi:hypothetical protein